jgi:hypothetical protein
MEIVIDLVGPEGKGHEKLGFEAVGLSGGKHSDDSVKLATHANRFTDDLRIAGETLFPELVRQDDNTIFAELAFFGEEVTAETERASHHGFRAGADGASLDEFWSA